MKSEIVVRAAARLGQVEVSSSSRLMPAATAVGAGDEVTGIEQDADGVTVTSTADGATRTTRARYAIGADGGSSSATRGRIGCKLLGDTDDVTWVVVDCHVKRWWPDRDFLTFWSDKERPVVDIALSAGNHRWEIPLKPDETPADYPTSAEIRPLLKALGVSEDDVEIHQHAFYQHHVRMADTFRRGRVFLAGDAAHLMPPWAGAGMQTGMRDAHNLGWKLARVLKDELPESWLDTYEAERRPNAVFYTGLAVGLGRMIPQPITGDTTGRMARLDDHLGHQFVLLGEDIDPATLLSAEEKADWDELGAHYRAVRPKTSHTQGPDELVDLDEVVLPWMHRYGARVIAVRPDRFVAAADTHGLAVPAV